jgi:predicted Zn finger-like uncharacterized protein
MNVSCPDCRSIFRVDPAKVPPSGVRARCSVCSGVITIPAPTGQTTPAGGGPRAATPASSAPVERARPTPPASPGWDSSPYSGQARQTPAAPPVQRVAPAPPPAAPPAPPRAPEASAAPRPARVDPVERGPVTATATPPSPASAMPEFRTSPPVPPFTPPASSPAPVSPFTPPTGSAAVPSAPPFVPSASAPRPAPPRPPATPAVASPAVTDGGARRPVNPFLSKDPNQRAKRLARALVSDIITYHPAKHAEGLRDGTLKQLFREEIKKSFEEYIAQVGQQLAESTTYFQEALNEVLAAGKKIF